jgi:hypothetical protein
VIEGLDLAVKAIGETRYVPAMQTTIDIDAGLFRQAEQCARKNGQPLSLFIEQALRDSLQTRQQSASVELHGEPLTDEDIEETARVTFRMLDEEEKRAQSR